MQCCRDTFFLHEPARLQKAPFSVDWKFTLPKWKFLQRNSGSNDVYFVFITTKVHHRAFERFGADKNSRNQAEHFSSRLSVSRLIHVDQHIRAMKRNHPRFRPLSNQGQKMDCDVSKENVQN